MISIIIKISCLFQNYIHREKMSNLTSGAGNTLGIAIGCIVVFVVIVVGAVVLRRRSQRGGAGTGFVEVDQTTVGASPEERHVASMQMNGYENPTYKFFEMNTSNGNNAPPSSGSNA